MDFKLCAQCGAVIDNPAQKFCGACGAAIVNKAPTEPVCPKCGSTRYEPFHKWCQDCSTDPASTIDDDAKAPPPLQQPSEQILVFFSEHRNKLIVIGGIVAVVIISILLMPNHFKNGMDYIADEKWDQAIESFTKVDANSTDYFQARQGLALAKAQQLYQSNKWHETILGLDQINAYSDTMIQRVAATLRDSAQFHMGVDTLSILMPRLKYLIQEDSNHDMIRDIIISIGKRRICRPYVKSHFPNGKLIMDYANRLMNIEYAQNKQHDELSRRNDEIISEIEKQKETIAELKKAGIRWREFAINKLFDQQYDDDAGETKGVYSGLIMSPPTEVVIIAAENEIPNEDYRRISLTLLVKSLGNKPYTKGNAYGYQTTVYAPTYVTVKKDMDPNQASRDLVKLQREKIDLPATVAGLKDKLKSEKDNIVTAAIAELKQSQW